MAVIGIVIPTPCGPIVVKKNVPIPPFPDFSIYLNIKFPPEFPLPMPDCSLLNHITGSAPEPPEDSEP